MKEILASTCPLMITSANVRDKLGCSWRHALRLADRHGVERHPCGRLVGFRGPEIVAAWIADKGATPESAETIADSILKEAAGDSGV